MQQLRHHDRTQISEKYVTKVLYNAPYSSPSIPPAISLRGATHSPSGSRERAGAKLQLETVRIAGRGIRTESGSQAVLCLGVRTRQLGSLAFHSLVQCTVVVDPPP